MNAFSRRAGSLRPSITSEMLRYAADPSFINFGAASPGADFIPDGILRDITEELLTNNPAASLGYTLPEGFRPLRDAIKDRLYSKGILSWNDDDLLITSGAQQAVDIISRLICNEGDAVICPDPCPAELFNTFNAYGARIVSVICDGEGMDISSLEKALNDNPRTAFIYINPDYSDPTGITLSEERRKQVLEAAYRHNVLIIEDGSYSELGYAGDEMPSIRSLDKKGNVIYVGGFSAVVSTGLSVGYICCSKNIYSRAVCALEGASLGADSFAQHVIHRLLTRYSYDEYLDELREKYRKKSDLLLNCLKYKMPYSVEFTEPYGGFFLWGRVPDGDLNYFCRKVLENKVIMIPGNAFAIDSPSARLSFRLSCASVSDEEIEKGTDIIASIAKTLYK